MEKTSRYLDTSGTGAYSIVASSIYGLRAYGSAVMYDRGKVLIVGGASSDADATPTNTAEVIDLTSAKPAWRNVAPMAFARRYLNATLMADGKVLISGGSSGSPSEDCTGGILPAEIWDPSTETFTTVASMPHYRTYHSTAALLPDGRVISSGTTSANGAGCGGIDFKDADFYSPPYLFRGPRPSITSAPAWISYGQRFKVVTPDAANITKVNLLAFGAVTHHFNFSQRINRVKFGKTKSLLTVIAPANPNVCPPGKYMMFILNGAGVPSLAGTLQIGEIKITNPVKGTSVSGSLPIKTQMAASVRSFQVSIDGVPVGHRTRLPFIWNSASVANGLHTISTAAFGGAGVQVGSDFISVSVSN
jgi:hypothetical protein